MIKQNKRRSKAYLAVLLVLLISFLTACGSKSSIPSQPVSKTEVHLGTPCQITIYDKPSDKAFEKIFKRLAEIEDKMTINDGTSSEVEQINSKAGIDYVKVSYDTYEVIKTGKEYAAKSGGRFDISIGPLVKLWNIGPENPSPKVPEQSAIETTKALTDYNKILLDDAEKKIMLKDKNMKLDLGGIAKGYAADEAIRILKENGVDHAIVNLGGNVFTLGTRVKDGKIETTPWNIGIQNPFDARDEYIGVLKASDKTVVTSGVYERYFEENGKRYHHILDPKTGYPVENELAGITIVTDKSMNADALSTSVFSMGVEEGIKFVETQKNVEAIFITYDKEVYITSGLKNIYTMTNDEFKVMN